MWTERRLYEKGPGGQEREISLLELLKRIQDLETKVRRLEGNVDSMSGRQR